MGVKVIDAVGQRIIQSTPKGNIAKEDGQWLVKAATADDGFIDDDERKALILFRNAHYDQLSSGANQAIMGALANEGLKKPTPPSPPKVDPTPARIKALEDERQKLVSRVAQLGAEIAVADVGHGSWQATKDAVWGLGGYRTSAKSYVAQALSRASEKTEGLAALSTQVSDIRAALTLARMNWSLYLGRGHGWRGVRRRRDPGAEALARRRWVHNGFANVVSLLAVGFTCADGPK